MIALSLTLSLLLPQDPGQTAASSKTMPEGGTLMFLELAPLERWRQVRDRVIQIQAFEDPAMYRFFRWIAASDGDRDHLSNRAPELFRVLDAFDEGFTAALLLDYGKRPTPRGLALVAAASKGSRVKAASKIFEGLFEPQAQQVGSQQAKADKVYRRTQRDLVVTVTPIADSPVRARYATWKVKNADPDRDWLSWRTPHLCWTTFGRRAAAFVGTSGRKAYGDTGRKHLERLIGLSKSRGGTQIGEPISHMEGEIQLLRGGLRFGAIAKAEGVMNERARTEIKTMGFDGWEGIQATLFSGPEGFREVYQILDEGKPNSFYRIFREPKAPLKQVLAHLPPETLAFARVGADGKALGQWLESGWKTMVGREDRNSFLRVCRSLLALPEQEAGMEDLDDLNNLTMFVLPASPGAPVPQPGILLECPEQPGEVRKLLEMIGGTILREAIGADESKVVLGKLGKGDDAVEYLSFKKLWGGAGQGGMNEMTLITNFFGGGFFSAKRVGPYLVLGCNPKDIRRMARSIAKGKNLLTRPEIQKVFAASLEPGAKINVLDAWVDAGPVIKGLGMFSTMLPMLLMSGSFSGDEAENIPLKGFPRWSDTAKLIKPESFQAVRVGSNIRIEHRGGTLLSPMAWWGFAMCEEFWGSLSKLVR